MDITYSVGDLKRIIAESSNEFKPVIGDGVESADKSNNREAYNAAKKLAKDADKKEPKLSKDDGNKTMLSVRPQNMDDKYKKRVKAQAKGYSSEKEEKNSIEKDPSAEFNEREYDAFTKEADEMEKALQDRKESGLVGKEQANKNKDFFKRESLTCESTKPKTAYFKHTRFINEAHMISRIPDELKNEGQVFHMKDNSGNDYTVKWTLNEAEVIKHENKVQLSEEMNRMAALWGYNPNDYYKKKRNR